MKTEHKAKATITLHYENLVLDIEDAVMLAQIIDRAEVIDKSWVAEISKYKYHISERSGSPLQMELISKQDYVLGKMAGKKEDTK